MRLWQTGHRKRASECSGWIKFHFLIIFFFHPRKRDSRRGLSLLLFRPPGNGFHKSIAEWKLCRKLFVCVCLHMKQPESQILWLNLFGIQKVYRIFGNIMGNQIEWNFIVYYMTQQSTPWHLLKKVEVGYIWIHITWRKWSLSRPECQNARMVWILLKDILKIWCYFIFTYILISVTHQIWALKVTWECKNVGFSYNFKK